MTRRGTCCICGKKLGKKAIHLYMNKYVCGPKCLDTYNNG